MPVSEQLRKAIVASGETHYRIAKEAGLHPIAIGRFVSGERPNIRIDTVDRLCDYFGLELAPRRAKANDRPQPVASPRAEAPGKQRSNKPKTAGKKRSNRPAAALKDAPNKGAARAGRGRPGKRRGQGGAAPPRPT